MLPQKNNSQNRAVSLFGAIMETADTPTNCTRRAFACQLTMMLRPLICV